MSTPGAGDRPARIDEVLDRVRSGRARVHPTELAAELAAGALVVDTRPVDQRATDGELPGAVVIDRNVLEWRLDPTSAHRLAVVDDAPGRIIVVCDEGYSSGLAAASLRTLGLTRATDLVGGFQLWMTTVRDVDPAWRKTTPLEPPRPQPNWEDGHMPSESRMVALGFGKYARADRIYALEPLLGDDRGDGRRTRVWVEGLTEPIVASRTEATILRDMGQEAAADAPLLDEAIDLAARLAAAADAGRVDLSDLGRRARRLLAATTTPG